MSEEIADCITHVLMSILSNKIHKGNFSVVPKLKTHLRALTTSLIRTESANTAKTLQMNQPARAHKKADGMPMQ